MVGAKKPHIVIAGNLVTLFNNYLDDTPCIVLNSDTKVRLEEADCYYYPDVAGTCPVSNPPPATQNSPSLPVTP